MIPVIDALCAVVLLLTIMVVIMAVLCGILLHRVNRLEDKTLCAFTRLLRAKKKPLTDGNRISGRENNTSK